MSNPNYTFANSNGISCGFTGMSASGTYFSGTASTWETMSSWSLPSVIAVAPPQPAVAEAAPPMSGRIKDGVERVHIPSGPFLPKGPDPLVIAKRRFLFNKAPLQPDAV
jgi:hypothetical protein